MTVELPPEISELLAMSENWPPEERNKVLEAVRDILEGNRRAWYCTTKARQCDGKPHDGYPYPHARGDQWPPPGKDWLVWFLSGGRGSGKTRTGAEYARRVSEKVGRMALIAPTGADVRDTMIEGESGLMRVCAMAGIRIHYEPSKRRITFPNGCIATTFSGEEPDRLRGPQHGYAWLDEPAHMPLINEIWDNLLFGLRLGTRPHITLTTTPLPTKWVKKWATDPRTRLVRVSTYKNIDNLAPTYRDLVVKQYEGTRKGKQELEGAILADVEGALWSENIIVHDEGDAAEMDRIIIAIDPAGTANRRSDETGIVVAGVKGEIGYVFEDASGKYTPNGWAEKALKLYKTWDADAIICEVNFGADMVRTVIERAVPKNEILPPRIIETRAMKSKRLRAEPVVALYEQGRVLHVGDLADLEDEMLTWVPGHGDSPNRVDALVWALTELQKPGGEMTFASAVGSTLRPPGRGRNGLGGFLPRRRSA